MPRLARLCIVALALISASAAPALADVAIGARTGIGGGVGSAPRPVYSALAGLDASVTGESGWGVSASFDRVILERPGKSSGSESQTSLFVTYRKNQRKGSVYVAFGAGIRRLRMDSGDPLLGDIELSGVNLLHIRTGAEWKITERMRVGFAFDWTVGGYNRARYQHPDATMEARDEPAPALEPWARAGGANTYLVGPRISYVLP